MNLTDKMAYLRGMVDGMELDLTSTKEGKVLGQLLDVMQDLTAYVSDLQTQVDELTEVCDLFDQDLGDLEDIVYDEDDEDDAYYSCDDDDDFDVTILTTTMMRHSMRQSARPAIMSSL